MSELVREWWLKANRDAGGARILVGYGPDYYDAACYHCWQAAEKYIKAYLVSVQTEFRKTHVIAELLPLVARTEPGLAAALQPTAILSQRDTAGRYPGEGDADRKMADEAIKLAELARQSILPHVLEEVASTDFGGELPVPT